MVSFLRLIIISEQYLEIGPDNFKISLDSYPNEGRLHLRIFGSNLWGQLNQCIIIM